MAAVTIICKFQGEKKGRGVKVCYYNSYHIIISITRTLLTSLETTVPLSRSNKSSTFPFPSLSSMDLMAVGAERIKLIATS